MKKEWHILEREDGTVCVYYTREDSGAHWIVIDDLNAFLEALEDISVAFQVVKINSSLR